MDWDQWFWAMEAMGLDPEEEDDMGGRQPRGTYRPPTATPPPPPMKVTHVGKVEPGSRVQAMAGGLLILPPPEPPELPGTRARRWCYGIGMVASLVTIVISVVVPDLGWLSAVSMTGLGVAFAAAMTQHRREQAMAPDPEPSAELHSPTCDTPGCTCRPAVWDWCATGDHVVEDSREMVWTVDGAWACRGCANVDIAPEPEVGELMEAVAEPKRRLAMADVPAPSRERVNCRDEDEPSLLWTRENLDMYAAASWGLHTQELPNKQAVLDAIEAAEEESLASYQQVRADGTVLRDWGSSRRITG